MTGQEGGARRRSMERQRAAVEATRSQAASSAGESDCDRDVVRMAKLILADFTDISRQTAYELLRLAASRRKSMDESRELRPRISVWLLDRLPTDRARRHQYPSPGADLSPSPASNVHVGSNASGGNHLAEDIRRNLPSDQAIGRILLCPATTALPNGRCPYKSRRQMLRFQWWRLRHR